MTLLAHLDSHTEQSIKELWSESSRQATQFLIDQAPQVDQTKIDHLKSLYKEEFQGKVFSLINLKDDPKAIKELAYLKEDSLSPYCIFNTDHLKHNSNLLIIDFAAYSKHLKAKEISGKDLYQAGVFHVLIIANKKSKGCLVFSQPQLLHLYAYAAELSQVEIYVNNHYASDESSEEHPINQTRYLSIQSWIQNEAKFLTYSRSNVQARIDQHHRLQGIQSSAKVLSWSHLRDKEIVTHNTLIDHQVEQSFTVQMMKSLLEDQSQHSFTGKIKIAPQCPGVNAEQLSRSILMSPKAHAFHRPQLEIDTDEVKCSHGASIGRIDEEQWFYLTSRGMNNDQVSRMLIEAQQQEVLNIIDDGPLAWFLQNSSAQ